MAGDAEAGAPRAADEKGGGSRIFSRRVKLAGLGIAALIVVTSPLWAPLLLRRMDFFHVRRIEIVGAHYVAPSDILARLHVDTTVSVWDATSPLVARVAAHPEIAHVSVHRKLPGTLVVNVTEREPVALVPAATGFQAYDERGARLPIDLSRVVVDAPVLFDRDTTMLRLLGALRSALPDVYKHVSDVRHTAPGEVRFDLDSMPVRAMENVTVDQLAEVSPVAASLAAKNLRAAEIDLRYRDQVIARLP